MEGAHGMFRWVACQLDILGKCRTRSALRKCLATLPSTLDETYERILYAIPEDDFEHALCILRWLAFSTRPLTVEEISEVVAIDTKRTPAFNKEDILEDSFDVLSICSSLVVTTLVEPQLFRGSSGNSNIVALAHYSVKEYLTSKRIQQSRMAHYSLQDDLCNEFIAKSCIGYLLQFETPGSFDYRHVQESRLLLYAAKFWIPHSQAVTQMTEALSHLTVDFFSNLDGCYLTWAQLYNPDYPSASPKYERTPDKVPAPLYYASLVGLIDVVRLLLNKANADINREGGHCGTALHAASTNGYDKIVELLLSKGADVNQKMGMFGTALQAASAKGYDKIVDLLLNKGADVNMQGGVYDTALHAASIKGYDKIIQLLLSKGANINHEGGHYGSALQAASARGYAKTTELLLSKGADANHRRVNYGTALEGALSRGHYKIVKLLLDKGASIGQKAYHAALESAKAKDHTEIIEQLLALQTIEVADQTMWALVT